MIGRDANVGGTATDHSENRREHASHASDLLAIGISGGRKRVIVPEQLVRAVDEVDFQLPSSDVLRDAMAASSSGQFGVRPGWCTSYKLRQ
jgi:hypothetical protein